MGKGRDATRHWTDKAPKPGPHSTIMRNIKYCGSSKQGKILREPEQK